MDNLQLTDDYRDFLDLLHGFDIDYLLVGGYAVGLHGLVRATKDIDFWVGTDPANAEKLLKVVYEFAGTTYGISLDSFTRPDSIVFLGIEPYRIDLITTISGVSFEDCLAKSVLMELDGIGVRVIDFVSLIKNKESTGREADRLDVIKLREP